MVTGWDESLSNLDRDFAKVANLDESCVYLFFKKSQLLSEKEKLAVLPHETIHAVHASQIKSTEEQKKVLEQNNRRWFVRKSELSDVANFYYEEVLTGIETVLFLVEYFNKQEDGEKKKIFTNVSQAVQSEIKILQGRLQQLKKKIEEEGREGGGFLLDIFNKAEDAQKKAEEQLDAFKDTKEKSDLNMLADYFKEQRGEK